MDSWEVLEQAGVPYGRATRGAFLPSAVAEALADVMSREEALDPRQRVALLAWLRAFATGWPRAFQELFHECGDASTQLARAQDDDRDRYLKLKRIARENLARFL